METLILSCGTGGGHNAAAAAIKEAMEAHGHRVETLNPYELGGGRAAAFIDHSYSALVQKAPEAFGMIYWLGDTYRKLPLSSPVYSLNKFMGPMLEEYITQHHYDAIVTTHLFPAEILTGLKRKGKSVPKTWFVATDYTCIPFTEETDCDFYIIPSKELTDEFAQRGIARGKLFPLGIPVRREFSQDADRLQIRSQLGLSKDRKVILVAGGGIGAGAIPQIVSLLRRHFGPKRAELVIVCGNNEALYEKMQETCGNACKLLRYTSQMSDYMKACDLFLSKPGGLSSTEAAVVGTALIHVAPIPGCETYNMRFFSEHGMSAAISSPSTQLLDACEELLDDKRRRQMCENQHAFIPRNAAENICRFIESRA